MKQCPECMKMCPPTHFYGKSGKSRCVPHLKWPMARRWKVMEPYLAVSKRFTCTMGVLHEPDSNNDGLGMWTRYVGTGPNRKAAILDAVAKVKEANDE